MLFGRRRRPRLSREEALSALPVRNPRLATKRGEHDELMIVVPRRSDWMGRALSVIFVVPKERLIALDEVGADIWELCDGNHTVAQLVEAVGKKHKLNRKEAEVSLTTYLRQLGKRGLIVFAVKKDVERRA